MDTLTRGERALVALGAALGSNCIPCMQFQVPEARRAGYSDQQISEAISLADDLRRVPARKVLDTAHRLIAGSTTTTATPFEPGDSLAASGPDGAGGPCCG